MRDIVITAPLFIDMPRKTMKDKRYYINLNVYRNLHHRVNGQLKKAYLKAVRGQLEGLSIETPVEITYKVYKPTRRTLDNDDHVKTETILPTEYDKNNGRVEVTISTVD